MLRAAKYTEVPSASTSSAVIAAPQTKIRLSQTRQRGIGRGGLRGGPELGRLAVRVPRLCSAIGLDHPAAGRPAPSHRATQCIGYSERSVNGERPAAIHLSSGLNSSAALLMQ